MTPHLAPGDEAFLLETGERVRIIAEQNTAGDFLVEDGDGAVVIVPRDGVEPTWWRRAGCGCCGGPRPDAAPAP